MMDKMIKKNYFENEVVAHEGDECLGLYIVLEGELVAKNIFFDGNEAIIKYINKNEIYGDILLFSDHNHFPATIICQTDCLIGFIPKDKILNEIKENPNIALNFLKKVSNQAYEFNDRVKLLSKKSIRSRLCYYLLNEYHKTNNPLLIFPFNREKMAKILNLERPSLSRELKNLKKLSIIDYYLNTIKILNLEKLKEFI